MDYNSYEYGNPYCTDPYQHEFAQFTPSTQQIEYDQAYSDAFQPYSQQLSSFGDQPHFDTYQPAPAVSSLPYNSKNGESSRPIRQGEEYGYISPTEHFASVPHYSNYHQLPDNYYQPVSSVAPDSNDSRSSGSNVSTHSAMAEAGNYLSGCYALQNKTRNPTINHGDATVRYQSISQRIQSCGQTPTQLRRSQALISYVPLGCEKFGPALPVRKARNRNTTPKKPDNSGTKKPGLKTVFSDFQFKVLQQRFSLGTNASRLESITLAKNLNLTETQVSNWFANRKKRSLTVEFVSAEEDLSRYWTPRADGEKVLISLNSLSKGQLEELHKKFSEDHRLTGLERKEFAEKIDVNEKTVELWFARQRKIFKNQNRMRSLENNSI